MLSQSSPNVTCTPTMRSPSALSLHPARDWALFLDVDGTILHLRDTPDSVEAGGHLLDLLETILRRLDGAVALVSGRGIDNLDALFAPHKLPTAGLHGLERRDAAGMPPLASHVVDAQGVQLLRDWIAQLGGC